MGAPPGPCCWTPPRPSPGDFWRWTRSDAAVPLPQGQGRIATGDSRPYRHTARARPWPPPPTPHPALPPLGDGSERGSSAERRLGDRIIRELYRDPDYID